MDIYGVLIDAHYFMLKENYNSKRINIDVIINIAEKICERWKKKDHSIWEIGNRQNITHIVK